MAENKNTTILNIGSQTISLGVFENTPSGQLQLNEYHTEVLSSDPAIEATKIDQISVAIGDLLKKTNTPTDKIRYCVSGQSVFIRFIKLPPIQESDIEQLVIFEAQQHVPLPLSEVVWDYSIIPSPDAEKSVLFIAIKRETLDEINNTFIENKLSALEVDSSPTALYNSFIHSYGYPNESVLLIDIGAKTSNLLYIHGAKFFTRSITVGGVSITASIAKEYNVSFNEAEYQKTINGLVALAQGHTEEMNDAVAALSTCIRNALTRLPSEITRTTNYYRSQYGGQAPQKIYLAGGGVNLPYTLEFIEEKLSLPVEFFNPLKNILISQNGENLNFHRNAHMMGELVGLALRSHGKSSLNIDLVPTQVGKKRKEEKRKPFLIAASAACILGSFVWALCQNKSANASTDYLTNIKEQQIKLEPLDQEIQSLLSKENKTNSIAEEYNKLVMDQAAWFKMISELKNAFSSNVTWITKIEPISDYADPINNEKVKTGSSVITIPTSNTNSSAIGNKDQKTTAKTTPKINALRIEGFWRKNPKEQNVVSDQLKKLRDKSEFFRFTSKSNVELKDEQILEVDSFGQAGDLAFQFKITIPLTNEISAQ